jgi:hypothetical protein
VLWIKGPTAATSDQALDLVVLLIYRLMRACCTLAGSAVRLENAELVRLYAAGTISAATRHKLQHTLDLELTRFSHDTD